MLSLLLSKPRTHALLTIVTEEFWILERSRIRVDGQIQFQSAYVCGRENFGIRKEKVADSKITGYVWTGLHPPCGVFIAAVWRF